MPAYLWYRGCTPTAGGMIIGYWDGNGYPDLVEGDAFIMTLPVRFMMSSNVQLFVQFYDVQ